MNNSDSDGCCGCLLFILFLCFDYVAGLVTWGILSTTLLSKAIAAGTIPADPGILGILAIGFVVCIVITVLFIILALIFGLE